MDIPSLLKEIGLAPFNSVVIGSGILQAHGIRKSNDIDVVVDNDTYERLLKLGTFTEAEQDGKTVLKNDVFEIGKGWGVLGNNFTYQNLIALSSVVEGVRYCSLEFLLAVKESWVEQGAGRDKDVQDIHLIKDFIATNHVYQKNVDGFLVPQIDPIQDIMSDDELKEVESTIFNLIEDDESADDGTDSKKS